MNLSYPRGPKSLEEIVCATSALPSLARPSIPLGLQSQYKPSMAMFLGVPSPRRMLSRHFTLLVARMIPFL